MTEQSPVAQRTDGPEGPLDDASRERRLRLMDIGRRIVPQLWGILRTLGIYSPDNETPHRALQALAETLRETHEHDEAAALIPFADSVFLNGSRLRLDTATHRLVQKLSRFFEERRLGGISVVGGFDDERLMRFMMHLRGCARADDPREELEAAMGVDNIDFVLLINPQRRKEGKQEREDFKLDSLEAYVRAMCSVGSRGRRDENPGARARRQQVAVRRLVAIGEKDEHSFLQLSALRGVGDPSLDHTLNTTILALALGQRAGLSRKHLVMLGVAAMNHDVGESLGPREIGATLDREELQRAHPVLGMRYLLDTHGTSGRMLQRAIVCAEHHRSFDGRQGFPDLPARKPHLFARVIGLCDAYDSMLAPDEDSTAMPPDQALKRLTRGAGRLYDPTLVALFAGMVGRYPPGTLVELDSGDLAIVVARGNAEDHGQARPRVLRIRDAMGRPVTPMVMDLSERVPGKRRFQATVVRSRDPLRLGINVASYLFSSDSATVFRE